MVMDDAAGFLAAVGQLTALTRLAAGSNQVNDLPDSWQQLKQLQVGLYTAISTPYCLTAAVVHMHSKASWWAMHCTVGIQLLVGMSIDPHAQECTQSHPLMMMHSSHAPFNPFALEGSLQLCVNARVSNAGAAVAPQAIGGPASCSALLP
jgi:hypothetical protein